MKKWLVVLAVLMLAQNWHRIGRIGQPPPVVANGDVFLFATATCPYCAKTRQLLADYHVPYIEIDIDSSEDGRKDFARLGGRGVPLLIVGNTPVHGYNEDAMLSALYALHPR